MKSFKSTHIIQKPYKYIYKHYANLIQDSIDVISKIKSEMLFVRLNATKYYRSAMTQANSSFIHTKKLAARELIKDIYIKERHKVGKYSIINNIR